MPSRIRQLPELVTIYGTAASRSLLEVYSTSEVDVLLDGVTDDVTALDGRVDTLETDMGTAQSDITSLDGRVTSNETDITNAQIDIDNLDISLTAKIATDCIQSAGSVGVTTTANGTVEVTINGVTFYLLTSASA